MVPRKKREGNQHQNSKVRIYIDIRFECLRQLICSISTALIHKGNGTPSPSPHLHTVKPIIICDLATKRLRTHNR